MKRNKFIFTTFVPVLFSITLLFTHSCFFRPQKSVGEYSGRGEEGYKQGWYKSNDNPLVIFEGDLGKAPKNCVNSPVILRTDNCPYKNYKWAFLHLATDPKTYENYLSITFATDDGFRTDHWEYELEITGNLWNRSMQKLLMVKYIYGGPGQGSIRIITRYRS